MKLVSFAIALICGLLASCGSKASDSCLVGAWKAQGNGAAQWMARHMPGTRLNIGMRKAQIRFTADGTYASGVDMDARASIQDGGSAATHGPMSMQSHGHWRTEGDQLILMPSSEHASGSVDYVTGSGKRINRPMPVPRTQTVRMTYTCQAKSLVTRKSFPGMTDAIIQRYVRMP